MLTISFAYKLHSKGPNMFPWRTPEVIDVIAEDTLFKYTYCFRCFKYEHGALPRLRAETVYNIEVFLGVYHDSSIQRL